MAEEFNAEIFFPKKALSDPVIHRLVKDLQYGGEDRGITCYYDPFALNGEFSELEQALVERGYPFDRFSDGCDHIDPEVRHFRPGRNGKTPVDIVFPGSNYIPAPIINVDYVKESLRKMSAEEFLELLEKEYPTIPPLFEFIEEECEAV